MQKSLTAAQELPVPISLRQFTQKQSDAGVVPFSVYQSRIKLKWHRKRFMTIVGSTLISYVDREYSTSLSWFLHLTEALC